MSIKQALQLAATVIQNLPVMSDKQIQQHIDNPKDLQPLLRKALLDFPILMTVKLGTGLKTADDFRQALKRADDKLDDWSSGLLNQYIFKVTDQPTEVSVIAPTVAELGFKEMTRYADICQRGLELGYKLCPPELGPQLRLQYKNQPKGEVLRLAMEAIYYLDGCQNTFIVEHDGSACWLLTQSTGPDRLFHLEEHFIFISRK